MLAPDPAPLTAAREADKRVVGACRHFAVLRCAIAESPLESTVTGADYDALLDELAGACATDDPENVTALYGHQDLRVPESLSR
ncbi:hypothetical protein [Amycolatopsis thailandensis]|uniref:hypothetical protein n=1 Tax=Amycolatopsis thailandensis TaxID=589330 RepID=UPI001ABFFA83|nr:hypothetical protein [Amycolatopsis thailandensis]